jgi:hypothetical protein
MSRRALVALAVGVALAALAVPGRAQETTRPEAATAQAVTPRPKKAPTLLRVQVTLARFQGERKVASSPYSMLVTTDMKGVKLRMGVEVPISVASFSTVDGKPAPVTSTSFQYRNVGTNIDCRADEIGDDGLYQLGLGVESSSIYTTTESRTTAGLNETGVATERPLFRTFNVNLNPLLRDGQSVQTVASTDPVTGEIVKIDVTLNVVR